MRRSLTEVDFLGFFQGTNIAVGDAIRSTYCNPCQSSRAVAPVCLWAALGKAYGCERSNKTTIGNEKKYEPVAAIRKAAVNVKVMVRT